MYKHYYFNKNKDEKGLNEVHTKDCSHQPYPYNREYIGYFSNCKDAIRKAKSEYPYRTFDGCYWCSRNCHTG